MLCCPVLVASCGLRPGLLGSELDSRVIALFNWRSDPLRLESRTSDVVWLAAAAVGAMGIGNAAVAASIPRMPLPVSLQEVPSQKRGDLLPFWLGSAAFLSAFLAALRSVLIFCKFRRFLPILVAGPI